MLRRDKAPRRRGRGPRRAAFGLAQPFFHGIAGGERGRNPAFWAPARLCAVFLRLCKGRCGKVPRTRTPTHRARLFLGRVDDGLGLFGSATGEWPVLFENGRVAGPFRTGKDVALLARRRRRKPSVRHVLIRAHRPEAPQTYCLFGAACLHVGALGGNYFRMESPTFGMSSSGRVGHSLPAEGRSCFCGEQFFLFAEDSFCFSPKTRTALAFRPKIDIILISPRFAGPKRRSRRRASNVSDAAPRTFQASDFR